MKKLKVITLATIALFFLIVIPQCFAVGDEDIDNNQTITNVNTHSSSSDNNSSTLTTNEKDILKEDYYFNASYEEDGNGSEENPYNCLTENRIINDSQIHLSNGEYELTGNIFGSNILFQGESTENTILNGNGYTLEISEYLNFINITLKNIKIKSGESLTFSASNTVFRDCTNETEYGGAIYFSQESSIALINCTFYNNSARYGGAIYLNSGNIEIYNSNFENNSARYGGAIYTNNAFLECYNSTFISNIASMLGGAVASIRSENLKFNDTEFLNNTAGYEGGAIYSFYGNSLIANSTFNNNSASAGGALFIDNNTETTIIDNEFENNYAKDLAGAIYSLVNFNSIIDNNTYNGNLAKTNENLLNTTIPYLFIGDGNYIICTYNSSFTGYLPSYYDLRDYGYVTPVKNQNPWGNCWAFAPLAALESCILKATNITYDLSEENVKNLMAWYSDYGWNKMEPNEGGIDDMVLGYLISWLGPINEMDDIYSRTYTDLSLIFNSVIHVQNIVYLSRSDYTDNDAIKKAILDYGAVSTSIHWSSSYEKGDTYYYHGSDAVNHAVAIVGWDDNYSKNNFKETPPDDGAWIIKNSWGTSWGDYGYYYVSYYDNSIARPNRTDASYTFILNDTLKFDKNYQYDIPGKTDYFINSSSTVWYKNIFNSTDNEYLAAVSTFFYNDTDYEVSIYVNNALKTIQSGFSKGGYYTINLDEFIPLNQGDIFEVIFKITVDGEAGFPISEKVSLNNYFYKEGISFLSYDGENWTDLYDLNWAYSTHIYDSQVACIKAFTIFDLINTNTTLSIINTTNCINIQANVTNQYGRPVNTGNVTFTVNGNDYIVKVNNGIAILDILENTGECSISAMFNAVGHNSSENNISIILPAIDTYVSLSTLNEYNPTEIIATVTNQYGYLVNCGNVTFTVDNENITINITNGTAKLTHNFNNLGTNNIYAKFNSIYYYTTSNNSKDIFIKSTINSNNETKTLNSKYQITLLDNHGNPLNNQEITAIIGLEEHKIMTDDNGVATLIINLDPNVYLITIINPANNENKTQTITVVERITENNNLTTNYSANDEYKVKVLDDDGNIAKGVQVTFGINGEIYNEISDDNGYASFKTINLNSNNYTITAEYMGYTVSNKIVIIPINTTIQLSVLDITNFYNIQANVTDQYGQKVNRGDVTFIVDGIEYIQNVNNGTAILNLLINPNEYNISVIFNGVNYNYSENNITINVLPIYTNISLSTLNEYNPTEIIATVTNQYGYLVNCGNVTFTVDNENITINITNGTAKLTHNFNNLGTNNIYAKFNSIYYYTTSNNSKDIFIKSTINSNNETKTLNSKYQITLLDNHGNPLNNQEITLNINSKNYNIKTDNNGIATFNINLNPGVYTVKIINPVNNETKTQTINVIKRINENKDVTLYYGKTDNYKVKVLDDNGNIAKGVQVTFTFNGKTYTQKTDNNGYASLKISNLKSNIYTITAKYAGYVVSNKITVKNIINLNLNTVKTLKKSKLKTIVLQTKLKINDKIAKNKQVTFIFNNEKFTAKTNKYGIAKVTLKKSTLKKLLKKVKAGKKVIYQVVYRDKLDNKSIRKSLKINK